MTEKDFTALVIDAAHALGWRCSHFRPAQTAQGWRTTVQGDGKGYPDITAVHPRHGVIFAELKTDKGRLSPEQVEWVSALSRAGARIYVWRPSCFDSEVLPVLKGAA